MEVRVLYQKLGLENEKVKRKAEEYSRLCSVKRPTGLGGAEICKAAACLELATSKYGVEFNRDRAIQLSGSSERFYQSAIASLRALLGVKSTTTIKQLCVQFGCLRLETPTLQLLEEYKTKVLANLHESRKSQFDFDNPVYLTVCFFIQTLRGKIIIDKTKLLTTMSVPLPQFQRVRQSVMEVCFPATLKKVPTRTADTSKIATTRKKPAATKKTAKPTPQSKAELAENDENLITNTINAQVIETSETDECKITSNEAV